MKRPGLKPPKNWWMDQAPTNVPDRARKREVSFYRDAKQAVHTTVDGKGKVGKLITLRQRGRAD